mgnify:CR=1 FL=1
MDKKISVIVNCYNGEKYLNNCISSIINQKYKNLELIFFDNSSSDNSKKIINQYQDSRIRYFYSDTKLPLYSARNEAIQKSTGSLIAFLDVDDWWDENYLLSKKEFFNDTSLDYFYSNVLIYYEKENKYTKYNKFDLPNGKIYKYLANNYFIIISGLIIKKKILEKENYFNKNYNIIGDYDLVMRISKYAKAKSFNEPLIFYRVHDNNFSKLNNKIYYYEYKDWFYRQKKINDYDFQINEKKLLLKLNKLDIIYHLYENKNINLLIKIIKFPILIMKLKFLFSFFLPIKLVNYFRK